ncbi:MAG TPA: hypothetical protein PKE64_04015 [Anaerolineae bacterium]|nr:hypothetical protein [Anaerolineae bacterium]
MPPYLLLAVLLGAVYGVLFHLWRGKSFRDLATFLGIGVVGFALGQGVGILLGFDQWLIGPLHVVEASLLSWGSLFLVQWLKIW